MSDPETTKQKGNQLHVVPDTCQKEEDHFLGCTLPPDPDLLAAGWERRFIADDRMARDAVDTYTELGYDVKLQPLSPEGFKEECSDCQAVLAKFSMVYTRKKKPG